MEDRKLSEKEKNDVLRKMAIGAKLSPFSARTWNQIINKRRRPDGSAPEGEIYLTNEEAADLEDAYRADLVIHTAIKGLAVIILVFVAVFIVRQLL